MLLHSITLPKKKKHQCLYEVLLRRRQNTGNGWLRTPRETQAPNDYTVHIYVVLLHQKRNSGRLRTSRKIKSRQISEQGTRYSTRIEADDPKANIWPRPQTYLEGISLSPSTPPFLPLLMKIPIRPTNLRSP